MKTRLHFLLILLFTFATECSVSQIPNKDFENWTWEPLLVDWKTNSCPLCDPPWETYIVQKDSIAIYNGNYAAKFVYNNIHPAFATTRFPLSTHPFSLTAYIKNQLFGIDTTYIGIKLLKNSMVIDSGEWIDTASISYYTQLIIPISQKSAQIDSAEITIVFGNIKQLQITDIPNLWVDNLSLDYTIGIENINKNESDLIIFPNPANKIFTFLLTNNEKLIGLSVFNALGQQIFAQDISINKGTTALDISQFAEGIYFVHATTDKQTIYNRKIIIKR